jgi:hypothetical protein
MKSTDEAFENLIDGMEPELYRLKQRALFLDDREAAKELLRRATKCCSISGRY